MQKIIQKIKDWKDEQNRNRKVVKATKDMINKYEGTLESLREYDRS